MSEIVEVKLRRIGTSVGVLLPRQLLKKENLKVGETIEISVLKKSRKEEIERLLGKYKGLGHFQREKTDRF